MKKGGVIIIISNNKKGNQYDLASLLGVVIYLYTQSTPSYHSNPSQFSTGLFLRSPHLLCVKTTTTLFVGGKLVRDCIFDSALMVPIQMHLISDQ